MKHIHLPFGLYYYSGLLFKKRIPFTAFLLRIVTFYCLGIFYLLPGSNLYAQSCMPEVNFPGGRIALSADGNFHDKDDFGATPLALAMMQATGVKDKLVHLDYYNNLCANNSARDAAGNLSSFTTSVPATTQACIPGGSGPVYCETNGVVMFEAENTVSELGQWIKKADNPGFTGSGHLEFTGNSPNGGPATSPLRYTFKITKSGEYRLLIRARKRLDGQASDKNNDGYVRVEGDYTASDTASNVHNGNATLDLLKKDLKFFGGPADGWGWASKLDAGGKDNKRNAVYRFKAGETYTLVLSGRSINWNVDRIVFCLASVLDATAFGVMAETQCSGCENTVKLAATVDFTVLNVSGFAPAYKDNAHKAIAVNSVKYGTQWAAVQTNFAGSTGTYDIVLKTLTETDGESSYRIRINETLLAPVFKNSGTTQDYVPASYTWKGVSVKKGDKIQVEFQAHTNGRVSEGNGTAYSRGRWTDLEFICGSAGGS